MFTPTDASYAYKAENKISLVQAIQLLTQGQCLIYPTETFFAVGCAMNHPLAVDKIFSSKKRPEQKPLPVLAADWEQVEAIAHVGKEERRIAEQLWPGPLTLLCTAKEHVLPILTAGTGKVAVRISSHPLALELARAVGSPLVCSSANISGEAPPQRPQELSNELLQHVPHVLTSETACQGGLPSTIVEICAPNTLNIRRHGAISVQKLQELHWSIEQAD